MPTALKQRKRIIQSFATLWLLLAISTFSTTHGHDNHNDHDHDNDHHHHHHGEEHRRLQQLLALQPQGCGFHDPSVNEIYQLEAEQEERMIRVEEERLQLERQQSQKQQGGRNLLGCSISMGGGGRNGWDTPDDTSNGGGDSGGGGGGGGSWTSKVSIPTYIHNIHRTNGDGFLTDSTLRQSIQVANGLLSSSGFELSVVSIDHIENDSWFQASEGSSQESAMMTQLKKGGLSTLNIYYKLAVAENTRFCGYAYLAEDAPYVGTGDGVTVDTDCVSDRAVLAHEVGHWLNLLHTFSGGCYPGDLVADTNAQSSPYGRSGSACPNPYPDSCPSQPGLDPLDNVMDYSPAGCDNIFTKGQVQRMQEAWNNIRNR